MPSSSYHYVRGMHAGYTIHTVVALAHAGLIPLEHQAAVQQAFQQCAPVLSTTPESLTALMDKSLPTMIGLGGAVPSSSFYSLSSCCLCSFLFPCCVYMSVGIDPPSVHACANASLFLSMRTDHSGVFEFAYQCVVYLTSSYYST